VAVAVAKQCSNRDDLFTCSQDVAVPAERWYRAARDIRRCTVADCEHVDRQAAVGSIGNGQRMTTTMLLEMITSHEPLATNLTLKTLLTLNSIQQRQLQHRNHTNLYNLRCMSHARNSNIKIPRVHQIQNVQTQT